MESMSTGEQATVEQTALVPTTVEQTTVEESSDSPAAAKPGVREPQYRRTVSYARSGVSIHARPEAVEVLRDTAQRSWRPEVVEDAGGFAGLFRLGLAKYRKPLLASSTDGVGPKLSIAQQMDMHDTIGVDLVAMVVDDIVACGAEPLFMLYYLSCGEVVPDRVAAVTAGIGDGCRAAGCAMLGGETAEHPGVLRAHEYDLSGSGIGVVDEDRRLGAARVEVGDVIVAMGSSGLHANGYGLVQHALLGLSRMRLDTVVEEFDNQRTLGQELLAPTRIYARDCLDLLVEAEVRAFAHITGGGIAGNLERVLPEGADALVRRSSWRPQPVFDLVARKGRIEQSEMEATFNMGIGMAAVVAPEDAERAVAFLRGRGVDAWLAGEIVEGAGTVQLVGSHTRG
jgi:phosphoribosylformylglycinamidine cyclo-ligase